MWVEDIIELLQVCPSNWKIREATLVAIADSYPDMDETTFRLSLRRAVEQAKEGKTSIKHPNAWLKAAFEQNGAPLITPRDIEAQVTRGQGTNIERHTASRATPPSPATNPAESEVLRRYLAASEAPRQEVDLQAEEKLTQMRLMLGQIGPEKRQEIVLHARIEAARTVLEPLARASDSARDNRGRRVFDATIPGGEKCSVDRMAVGKGTMRIRRTPFHLLPPPGMIAREL